MKSVYSAVRTGDLNTAVCASSKADSLKAIDVSNSRVAWTFLHCADYTDRIGTSMVFQLSALIRKTLLLYIKDIYFVGHSPTPFDSAARSAAPLAPS